MSQYNKPTTKEELQNNFQTIKPLMNATLAWQESSRCLFCYDAPCVKACPTGIDIPLFIRHINTGSINAAAKAIYESNYFGNICGKVCPTEVLCEGACVYHNENAKPVEIGRLQSFASTQVIEQNVRLFETKIDKEKKVAVIGAGPAGLSCTCELRLLGYQVDVFEARSRPSGLTIHGIAPYKISNEEVLEEVNYLVKQFSFNISYNRIIESIEDLKELEKNYEAIFLGIGLGGTRPLKIEGEALESCFGATEFIEKVKLDPLKVKMGDKVVIIGGGNTAMDAVSEAARLGAKEVILAYRRAKEDMPAYDFEYELAISAGVQSIFNISPVEIYGNGKVEGIRFVKTKIHDGRIEYLEDSEFELPCDTVIKATGQKKKTGFLSHIPGLVFDAKGRVIVDRKTFQTTNAQYFCGGDAVNGGKEIVNAVAEGKKAAKGIHRYFTE